MKYYLLASLAFAFALTSCLGTGADTCQATLITPILGVTGPKTVAVNQTASFVLSYQLVNSCGAPAVLAEQVSGNVHTVNLAATYTGCSCNAVALPSQTAYTFQPTQAGTYYLQFYTSNAYITDTLVAK